MTRLSTIDGGFLLTESHHSPKHVAGLMVFELPRGKGPAWLRTLLDQMRRVPPGYPFDCRLKSPMGLQYELVPDEHFEIDYHVRHTVLPRPGNQQQLLELVSRLHANLLDRDRPLWEFHLIEGLENRRFAFYLKTHHAIGDGLTARRWTDDATTTQPDPRHMRPVWAREEGPPDDSGQDLDYVHIIKDGIRALGGGLRTAMGISAITAKMIRRRFLDGDGRVALPLSAPRTSLNVPTGAARSIAIASYSLEELRAVGKPRGCTINDVVMTMCDMALSRYFAQHDQAPEGPLVAYMPVNIRSEGDAADGNVVTLLQVKLASSHDDPLESLDEVSESIRTAREVFSGTERSAVQYYSLMVALMSQFEETLKLDRFLPPVNNLVISNVPGSPVRRYFKGAAAVAIYPISTLPPMTALNVTACSYAGTLYFGLVSARTIVPDLDLLAGFLDEALAELTEATGWGEETGTSARHTAGAGPEEAGRKRPDKSARGAGVLKKKARKKKASKKKAVKKKTLKKKARKKATARRSPKPAA